MQNSNGARCEPPRKTLLPLAVRLVNRIGPLFASLGMGRISLDPDSLIRAARRQAKLSDFGDGDFEEGLARLTESIEKEASLFYSGRLMARLLLKRRLITRLLVAETLRTSPEIGRRSVKKPMLVTGFARTGTTLLYNLLALDPRARAPQLWEVHFPAPPPTTLSPAQAARQKRLIERQFGKASNTPELRRVHAFDAATAHEECYPLLEPTFLFPSFGLYFDVAGYSDWLYAQPTSAIVPVYRYYAQMVNLMMVGHDGKRWLSKSPFHAFFLPALAEVFPDVQIVRTHRNPAESIPSLCSLLTTVRAFTSAPNPEAIGQLALDSHRMISQRFEEAAAGPNPPNVFDVDYEALIADPIGSVGRIHDHFGLPLTSEDESAMHAWLSEKNPWDANKHGRHVYSAGDYGLDETALARLAP